LRDACASTWSVSRRISSWLRRLTVSRTNPVASDNMPIKTSATASTAVDGCVTRPVKANSRTTIAPNPMPESKHASAIRPKNCNGRKSL